MNFIVFFVSTSFAFISADRTETPTCPESNGNFPTYIPDKDCSKFWECSNGIPYPFECPRGLLFNPVINTCDVPARVQCLENRNNDDDPGKERNSDEDGREENGPEDEYDRHEECDEIDIICPITDGDDPVYISHPDLSKFCQCSNGKPYLHYCQNGLQFNKDLNICDWPDFAGGAGDNIEPNNNNDEDDSDKGHIEDGNVKNNNRICRQYDRDCPLLDGDRPTYIPLPNLSQYCQCSNGIPYLHTCPDGLLFNAISNVCDWSSRTDENNGNNTNIIDNNEINNGDSSDTYINKVCYETNKVCPTIDRKYPTYIPLTNCSQFCQCSNGKPYLHNCPDGLYFNSVLNVCDWPSNAICKNGQQTQASNGSTYNGYSNTASNISDNARNITDVSEVCLQIIKDCPTEDGDFPVYVPVPGCFQFCQCSNGKPYLHNCPIGLRFDSILNVCNSPEDVHCEEIPD